MNTGELLVSLSGLPSGSALTHLMGIQTGTGTGETIYAPRLIVTTTHQQVQVVRRAKRSGESSQQEITAPPKQKQQGKYAYAVHHPQRISVLTVSDEMFITMTSESVL